MIKKNFIMLVCLLFVTCANFRYIPQFYSRNELPQNTIHSLFQNVPVFTEESVLKHYIIKLNFPNHEIINRYKKSKYVYAVYQPLIDEKGNIEAIYINNPTNTKIDSIFLTNILQSKFKTLNSVSGRKGKYSLLIQYHFDEDELIQIYAAPFKSQPFDLPPIPNGGYATLEKKIIYPESAKKQKIYGEVIIRFKVDTYGLTDNYEVLVSPSYDLSISAINAIKSIKWIPAKKNGKAIDSIITRPIIFSLK